MSSKFSKTKKLISKKEGSKPTNPDLYNRVKAQAKQKFDRWPSAYASAWLVKTYKEKGGGYK